MNCDKCLRPRATPRDWDMVREGEGANLCWENEDCDAAAERIRDVAPDMVRLLERVLDVWTYDRRTEVEVGDVVEKLVADIERVLARARGEGKT